MAPINSDEVKKVAEWARETLKSDMPAFFEKDRAGDLKPSELGYVLSLMVKGHSLALKKRGM